MVQIQAVLLDVGGVFHLPDHDRIAAALERIGIETDPPELDRAHYAGVAALERFHEGDHSIWLAYNRAYASVLGVTDDQLDGAVAELVGEFVAGGVWTRVIPGSRDALSAIADLGVKLAIVSNADGTVAEQLRADGICQVGPGPGVSVHAIVDSSIVGCAKPDPRIFELALGAIGVDPDAAVHVGDTPGADVAGARAAGVRPILVDPYDDHPHLDVDRVRGLAEVVQLVEGST